MALHTSGVIGDAYVDAAIGAVEYLGYGVLAQAMRRACGRDDAEEVSVEVIKEGETLVVKTPYNEAALPAFRALRCQPYDRNRNANIVSKRNNRALWGLLKKFYAGLRGVTRDGETVSYFKVPVQEV